MFLLVLAFSGDLDVLGPDIKVCYALILRPVGNTLSG